MLSGGLGGKALNSGCTVWVLMLFMYGTTFCDLAQWCAHQNGSPACLAPPVSLGLTVEQTDVWIYHLEPRLHFERVKWNDLRIALSWNIAQFCESEWLLLSMPARFSATELQLREAEHSLSFLVRWLHLKVLPLTLSDWRLTQELCLNTFRSPNPTLSSPISLSVSLPLFSHVKTPAHPISR